MFEQRMNVCPAAFFYFFLNLAKFDIFLTSESQNLLCFLGSLLEYK